jgi:hypothetical protein
MMHALVHWVSARWVVVMFNVVVVVVGAVVACMDSIYQKLGAGQWVFVYFFIKKNY